MIKQTRHAVLVVAFSWTILKYVSIFVLKIPCQYSTSRTVNAKTTKADLQNSPFPLSHRDDPPRSPHYAAALQTAKAGNYSCAACPLKCVHALPAPHPPTPSPEQSTAPFNLLERVAPRTMDTLPQCPSARKIFLNKDLFGHNRLLPNFRQTKCYTLRVTQPPLRQKSLEMMD